MALSNREILGKNIDILREGLTPFIEREMEAVYKQSWPAKVFENLSRNREWLKKPGEALQLDSQSLLDILLSFRQEVFNKILSSAHFSYVYLCKDWRNKYAHEQPISLNELERALDAIQILLEAAGASQKAQEVAKQIRDIKYEQYRRNMEFETKEAKKLAQVTVKNSNGIRPWREVIHPHSDVIDGEFKLAEFAANLDQVARNEGSDEYKNPQNFFARTFLTQGIRYLLKNAVYRLNTKGGDPVVDLQTAFGGGKTHSLLALYHLFSGYDSNKLTGINEFLENDCEGMKLPHSTKRVVLVGTVFSPNEIRKKENGIAVHTLWGELAYQLGGKNSYKLLENADKAGVNPGTDILRQLLIHSGPCLILIDEWVAFARQLVGKNDLKAGSFEANSTFAQSLTEAAMQVPHALVVVSLPESDIEVGGEAGREALDVLRKIFKRTANAWRPATPDEGFKIVSKRLFQNINNRSLEVERDQIIHQFNKYYKEKDFGEEYKTENYKKRMQESYPIHPLLFDILYEDWSKLEKFQKTRGVLRFMALVIKCLWDRADQSSLIFPDRIPLDDEQVKDELITYLDDGWRQVVDKEVDGDHSLSQKIDIELSNKNSECRRVARAIFLASAPTTKQQNPGVEEEKIRIACCQPGDIPAIVGDCLKKIESKGSYFYHEKNKFWFYPTPNLNNLARDKAEQYNDFEIQSEMNKRIENHIKNNQKSVVDTFPRVTFNKKEPLDIMDEQKVCLVVLGESCAINPKAQANSEGVLFASEVIQKRGEGPRFFKNMLVFLAPEHLRIGELKREIRHCKAWQEISNKREEYNLTNHQGRLADKKVNDFETSIQLKILETWCWLLIPETKENSTETEIHSIKIPGNSEILKRAAKKVQDDEKVLTEIVPQVLRQICENNNLFGDKNELKIKDLWDYLCKYLALPRLRDENVLYDCINKGLRNNDIGTYYALANDFDTNHKKYVGLVFQSEGYLTINPTDLLIKPEIAKLQIDLQVKNNNLINNSKNSEETKEENKISLSNPSISKVNKNEFEEIKQKNSFYALKQIDLKSRPVREFQQIFDEVIMLLQSMENTSVTLDLEIRATIKDGFDEKNIRSISENCKTLGFESAKINFE